MSSKQWLLAISAIILVIALFLLPMNVIDNDLEEVENTEVTESHDDDDHDHAEDVHHVELDSSSGQKLQTFRSDFENASEIEKKSIFADSLAELYAGLRNYDSAIYYAEVLNDLINSPQSKEKLADFYYESMSMALAPEDANDKGSKARALYTELLEEQSGRLDLMNKMAMTHIVSEAPMRGIQMLREILEIDENNEDAIFNLGVLSIQSGQFDKGAERFKKLTQLDDTNVEAWYFLGLCLKETGQSKEAKEALEKGLSLNANPEVNASIETLLKEL